MIADWNVQLPGQALSGPTAGLSHRTPAWPGSISLGAGGWVAGAVSLFSAPATPIDGPHPSVCSASPRRLPRPGVEPSTP